MSRAKYQLKNGQVVPGVTTVINLLAKPALIEWAWKCGVDGIDYHKVRDDAADIGELAHKLIHCYIQKTEPDLKDYSETEIEKATKCLNLFKDWFKIDEFEILASEKPMVSEGYQFGGTPDIVAKRQGEIWLIDLKTGNAIYEEHWLQVAAYELLWEENGGDTIDIRCILRLAKDGSKVEDHFLLYRDEYNERIFLHLLGIYQLQFNKKYGG